MGLLSFPLPSHSGECDDHQQHINQSLSFSYSAFSSSSLSSQRSLQSLPSLSSQRSLQSLPSLSSATSYHLLDHRQPAVCISTLKGHTSHVFSLIISGKQLYSGSYNDEIRVWPREFTSPNNRPYPVTATKGAAVKSLMVMGDRLFSAHQDHKIRVWKIDNNKDQNALTHQNRSYQCIATLPTLKDRFLKIFSPKNYVQVRRHKSCTWIHHVDTVSALALSQDGAHLYSASWDRTFKVWKTKGFRCLESVARAHDDAINSIVVSKDGHVYTGSADRTIKVWKKKQGERKHSVVSTLEKHMSAVNALALSSDGCVLYSGACDRSIIVWERSDQEQHNHMVVAGALRGHTKAILCLAVVDDLLCSGSADKTIRIWRRSSSSSSSSSNSYDCLAVLEGHLKPVKCLAVAVDPNNSGSGSGLEKGKGMSYLVYSGSLDCDIKVWRVWVPFF